MIAPHEPIVGRYPGADDKRAYLRSLFDRAAPFYDRVNGFGFLWTGGLYRRRALRRAGLRPGMDVVDVACGTGPATRACLDILCGEGRVTGVDPSEGMLAVARQRVRGAEFLAGHAEALPVADGRSDFVVMGYALRHVADLERAFGEFRRVLRPGGRLLVLEVSRPSTRFGLLLARTYFRDVLPVTTRLVTRSPDAPEMMRYFWETIEACVPPETILGAMRAAGFTDERRRTELGVFSAYTANRHA
jgi:demethylmenaquinone methyltransferase/2-methoxy-6-polyprenyl-1,4-benzoquinol methylase